MHAPFSIHFPSMQLQHSLCARVLIFRISMLIIRLNSPRFLSSFKRLERGVASNANLLDFAKCLLVCSAPKPLSASASAVVVQVPCVLSLAKYQGMMNLFSDIRYEKSNCYTLLSWITKIRTWKAYLVFQSSSSSSAS